MYDKALQHVPVRVVTCHVSSSSRALRCILAHTLARIPARVPVCAHTMDPEDFWNPEA
jgi:hypothetical protein